MIFKCYNLSMCNVYVTLLYWEGDSLEHNFEIPTKKKIVTQFDKLADS